MQKQKTLEVISRRYIENHLGMSRQDNFKLGLAVEGGAMRGIISGGMAMALRDLGMLDLFDLYVGSSGGSFNLAYVLSGEGNNGISLYYDHLTQAEILDLRRIAPGGRTVMDIHKLQKLLFHQEPFNFDKLLSRYGEKLYITATDMTKLQPAAFQMAKVADTYNDLLLAGATIPYIAGKSRQVGELKYADAFLAYPNPIMAAYELGCSHVLLLSTQPKGSDEDLSWVYKSYITLINREYPGISQFCQQRLNEYIASISRLEANQVNYKDMPVLEISIPQDSVGLKDFTTDRWRLIQGARSDYQSVLDVFCRQGETSMIPYLVLNLRPEFTKQAS